MASIPSRTATRQQRSLGYSVSVARTVTGAATAALALVVLAGCGSPSSGAAGGSAAGGSVAGATSSSAASATSDGSSSAPATPSSSAPQTEVTIHISGYEYKVPASVAPGATVKVMNMDGVNHTVSADSGGAFDVKATAGMATTFVAPSKPGSYPFHCIYHANMHGVLVVK
ncbi:MAG: cupredoxin domain-containing protein [Actinomycetota bacterium]|nr:cupredoxin domain-containing protein [Actinomycetota bacterium]